MPQVTSLIITTPTHAELFLGDFYFRSFGNFLIVYSRTRGIAACFAHPWGVQFSSCEGDETTPF